MHSEWYLRRQAGLIEHRQALDAGLSPPAIRRRVVGGRWVRLHPRVYLVADRELTCEVELRAAVLWAGPGAAAHGLAAAWWHGLVAAPPAVVGVTVPARRRPGPRPGVRLRRRDLATTDLVELRHLALTAVPLTVLEAAVELGVGGSALLDRALQRRVGFDTVWRAHCRNLGRHGSAAAGALLAAAADRAGSVAERRLFGLLRQAGLTGWVRGYAACGYELDVAFPAVGLAVEVDGWAWHADAPRFQGDRQRQNALVNAGWRVLRFTWHDLTGRPAEVVAEIRAGLAHGSARVSTGGSAPL